MANQIVVSAGAKVRNLSGVLTATSGVVSSVPLGAANGVATLDSGGKVPVSQLPSSVVTYLGTWNAATNTPTLVNGVGDAGDMYICDVAGTVNFGAGPVTFAVGDWVLYGSGTWQKSNGQNGTVTSVGLSTNAGAITIGNSPISTSGTITANFNGTNLQYVNGAGNLTTFPTLMTSVGLTMPSAFTVTNSPLTGAGGTLAVTGAGVASQYIRGDGTLADFPSSGGGGSSVSYYLNGGTSQGTIGGVTYYEMSKTAVIGTGVDFAKTGDGFIVAFLTDANDPAQLNIPAGNWNYEIYASMSSNGGTPQLYAELYVYDGTTFTLIATSPNEILYDGTALNLYTFAMAVPATTLALTDRLAIKLYATNSGGKTTTVHTQDSHLCQIITTFSTGITALNGLTAQVQYFQTGTSGTDFNISSTTATHTFNIPDASATARGLITTGTQTIAGTKTFNDATKNNGGIFLQNASSSSLAGYMNLGGLTNGVKFTSGGGISNTFTLPSATGYTFTFPNATGTIALTSDISYPVTSVFGRTGAVVATSGDYTTAQVTESGNLYFTDSRARLALSFVAGSGAYNSTTGVITIPTNNNQITNGSNYITLGSLSAGTGISYNNTTGVITNSAPDQTVSITAGAGISVSGTYPSFTIASTITQYTDALARAAISLTTTGTSGAATYNNTTGVLNIPQYIGGVTSVFGRTGAVVATEGDYSLTQLSDVTITSPTTGQVLKYNGTAWVNDTDANSGTVTSVAMTVPTGLSVSGSPITTSGTLGVTFAAGYSIPTDASQTTWDTAYTNRITSATSPLSITSNVISISQATTSTNGYLSSTDWNTFNGKGSGTVTSVAALTIGTSGTDLSSTVATSTTTPVITLNVPTASATNRGALSSADWTTFNNKQSAITLTTTGTSGAATFSSNTLNIPQYQGVLTNPVTGTGTTNYLPKFTGASTIGNSLVYDDGTNVGIGTTSPNSKLEVTSRITASDGGGASRLALNIESNTSATAYSAINSYNYGTSAGRPLAINESGGNVMINTTTDSGYKLDVNGTGRFSDTLRVTNSGTNTLIWAQGGNDAVGQGKGNIRSSDQGGTNYFDFGRDNLSTGNFVLTSGGGSPLLSITTGGAATFSSSVDATKGTFTSAPSLGGEQIRAYSNSGANTSYGGLLVLSSTGKGGYLTSGDNSTTTWYGAQAGYVTLAGTAGAAMKFRVDADDTKGLTIATTGAATFSSSLTIGAATALAWGARGGITQDASWNFSWGTNSVANAFYLQSSTGNVGIGTSSPNSLLSLNSAAVYYIDFQQSGTSKGLIGVPFSANQLVGGSASGDLVIRNTSRNTIFTNDSGNTSALYINSSNNVLIGTTTDGGTHKLQVNGSIIATGFFESSDSRLKTLIQDNYQTKGIASITPKLYTKNGKVELGYYAQDFVGILDSAVSKGSDDMLSLSYREVLVAKVYALEQRIKELENK